MCAVLGHKKSGEIHFGTRQVPFFASRRLLSPKQPVMHEGAISVMPRIQASVTYLTHHEMSFVHEYEKNWVNIHPWNTSREPGTLRKAPLETQRESP